MKKLARAAVATVAILGLGVPGIVGATSNMTGSDDPTSTTSSESDWSVRNRNNIHVDSDTSQHATSGDATVEENETGGSAATGNTENNATLGATVGVTNSSSTPAQDTKSNSVTTNDNDTPSDTDDSDTPVSTVDSTKSSVKVTNTNNIKVNNNVSQTATSGDAVVSHNATGGSATTGSASNSSTSTFELTVSN